MAEKLAMSLQFGLIYEFPLLILADSARVDDDDFSLPSSLGNYNYPYFQIYRRSVLLCTRFYQYDRYYIGGYCFLWW